MNLIETFFYLSDENMMDPYNLAICFGPTLVPIPTDRDQVIYQNLVNELIKNFIIFNEDIFPSGGSGTVYEKYISSEPDILGDYDTDTAMVQEDAEDEDDDQDDAMDDGKNHYALEDLCVYPIRTLVRIILKLGLTFLFSL